MCGVGFSREKGFCDNSETGLPTRERLSLRRAKRVVGRFGLLLFLLALASCTVVKPTYTQTGRAGYTINCLGDENCYAKAGDLCGERGYDIFQQTKGPRFNIVVACKAPGVAGPSDLGTQWYLMSPPTNQSGRNIDPQAPLSKWLHDASFDQASECQDALYARVLALVPKGTDRAEFLGRVADALARDQATPEQVFAGQQVAAKCIATDDPRLDK